MHGFSKQFISPAACGIAKVNDAKCDNYSIELTLMREACKLNMQANPTKAAVGNASY
jgi:hypothetical protein